MRWCRARPTGCSARSDTEIQTEVLTGWAVAARETGSIPIGDIINWLARRRDHIAAGRSSHAGRSRGFFRPPDRDALSREIAVEQHFLADQMRPHRRAQRLVGAVDRLERDAGLAGTEHDRRHHHVQAVEATCCNKT